MSKQNVEVAMKAQEELARIRVIDRNTNRALGPNSCLPKHKVKQYESIVTSSMVRLRNAKELAYATFKRLSNIEQAVVLEKVSGVNYLEG